MVEELTETEKNALRWVAFTERMVPWLENADHPSYTKENVVAKVLGMIDLLEGSDKC